MSLNSNNHNNNQIQPKEAAFNFCAILLNKDFDSVKYPSSLPNEPSIVGILDNNSNLTPLQVMRNEARDKGFNNFFMPQEWDGPATLAWPIDSFTKIIDQLIFKPLLLFKYEDCIDNTYYRLLKYRFYRPDLVASLLTYMDCSANLCHSKSNLFCWVIKLSYNNTIYHNIPKIIVHNITTDRYRFEDIGDELNDAIVAKKQSDIENNGLLQDEYFPSLSIENNDIQETKLLPEDDIMKIKSHIRKDLIQSLEHVLINHKNEYFNYGHYEFEDYQILKKANEYIYIDSQLLIDAPSYCQLVEYILRLVNKKPLYPFNYNCMLTLPKITDYLYLGGQEIQYMVIDQRQLNISPIYLLIDEMIISVNGTIQVDNYGEIPLFKESVFYPDNPEPLIHKLIEFKILLNSLGGSWAGFYTFIDKVNPNIYDLKKSLKDGVKEFCHANLVVNFVMSKINAHITTKNYLQNNIYFHKLIKLEYIKPWMIQLVLFSQLKDTYNTLNFIVNYYKSLDSNHRTSIYKLDPNTAQATKQYLSTLKYTVWPTLFTLIKHKNHQSDDDEKKEQAIVSYNNY